jgi:hypothetical protein
MRNLRVRKLTIALACALAAMLAVPSLLGAVAFAQSASDEYDLELPTGPDQDDGGGTRAQTADADPAPAPAPEAPVAEAPAPSGGDPEPAADTGNGSADTTSGSTEAGSEEADHASPQPPGFEPQLASGGTPGNPAAEDDFPLFPVALAAAAVLAVPFGIWLLRRGRVSS